MINQDFSIASSKKKINLFTIFPIQSCNLNCYYCPMKEWTYPVNDNANKLTNEVILKYLDEHFDPKNTVIQYSGGEPGLYPQIDKLLKGTYERGYFGLINTNGILPIPESPTFKRVAAWHESQGIDNPPKYFDSILIMQNPNDCWEEKVKYCEDHGIHYKTVQFFEFHKPKSLWKPNLYKREAFKDENTLKQDYFIDYWTIAYSSGQLSACCCSNNDENITMQKMAPPPKVNIQRDCRSCGDVGGFQMFFPVEWIDLLKNSKSK